MLGTNSLSTIGERSVHKIRMGRGVAQGSPLSPSLFNVYIYRLVMEVTVDGLTQTVELIMFADDVAGFAPDDDSAQRFYKSVTVGHKQPV